MSKIIRMTPEYIEECRKDFEASLKNAKLADGKITFTKTFETKEKSNPVFYCRGMGENGDASSGVQQRSGLAWCCSSHRK